jgi:hypothetical protein
MIAYKKLTFNQCQAADRQCTKDSLDPDVNVHPSIHMRHVASTTPIDVPLFSIDAKVPAKMGYIGICDPKATKWAYRLGEMVGDDLKFEFNHVEWDGK